MADTLSKFFKFIAEDPIMLGLCIAILVLVILFIAVLFMGRKTDKRTGNDSEENDSNIETFKTEINLDPVGTDTISPLEEHRDIETNVLNSASIAPLEAAQEVPVTFEEPVALEIPPKNEEMEIIDLRPNDGESSPKIGESAVSFPSFDDLKIQESSIQPDDFGRGLEQPDLDFSINEPTIERPVFPSFEDLNDIKVVESRVNPIESVEKISTPNNNSLDEIPKRADFEVKASEPRLETASFPSIRIDAEEKTPYSDEELNDFVELPTMNVPDISKTAIIRHMPVMENIKEPIHEEKKIEEEDLDIDLPKLNTNVETSVMTTLKGESFNIE